MKISDQDKAEIINLVDFKRNLIKDRKNKNMKKLYIGFVELEVEETTARLFRKDLKSAFRWKESVPAIIYAKNDTEAILRITGSNLFDETTLNATYHIWWDNARHKVLDRNVLVVNADENSYSFNELKEKMIAKDFIEYCIDKGIAYLQVIQPHGLIS